MTDRGDVVQLRRTYRGEEEWFPLLEELGLAQLRRGFIGTGLSPATASGLAFFLHDQVTLERHQTDTSRSRYRAILRDLEPATVRSCAIGGLFNSRRRAA